MKAILKAVDLKKIFNGTKKFVGTGVGIAIMQYIHIVVTEDEVRFEALDGHRFSVEYASVVSVDKPFECFIRPEIPKISKYDEYAEIELESGAAYITVSDRIIGYKQPAEKAYDLQKLVDEYSKKEIKAKIGVNSRLLADALNSITDQKTTNNLAKIEICNPSEPIIIRSNEKDIKVVLPVKIAEWS